MHFECLFWFFWVGAGCMCVYLVEVKLLEHMVILLVTLGGTVLLQ